MNENGGTVALDLITSSTDERLTTGYVSVPWACLYLRSLRAALAERDAAIGAKEKAEGALRSVAGSVGEFADAGGKNIVEKINFLRKDWEERLASMQMDVSCRMAPCPHEEEAKWLREYLEHLETCGNCYAADVLHRCVDGQSLRRRAKEGK